MYKALTDAGGVDAIRKTITAEADRAADALRTQVAAAVEAATASLKGAQETQAKAAAILTHLPKEMQAAIAAEATATLSDPARRADLVNAVVASAFAGSGFVASLTKNQRVPLKNKDTTLVFDQVSKRGDLGDSYDARQGAFTVPRTGWYNISCRSAVHTNGFIPAPEAVHLLVYLRAPTEAEFSPLLITWQRGNGSSQDFSLSLNEPVHLQKGSVVQVRVRSVLDNADVRARADGTRLTIVELSR